MSKTELLDTMLVNLGREIMGNTPSEGEILSLMHILYAYDVYVSEQNPIEFDVLASPLEPTQRTVAQIAAHLASADSDKLAYARWLHRMHNTFGNWYVAPDRFKPTVTLLLERLRNHPWISRVEQGLAEAP